MKILIASDTYYPHTNGASYFTQRLAHYLKLRGHTITVVAPSESIRNTVHIINDIPVYGVRSFPIFFYRGFRFAMPGYARAYIRKAIEDARPDVIHIQNHFIIGRVVVQEARKRGIPVVATNHFMPENLTHYLHLPDIVTRQINSILWWDFERVFAYASAVTTPTQTAASLVSGRLTQSVEAISCGIDIEYFTPRTDAKDASFLTRYTIPPERVLLYVGRLDKEKNLAAIIRSFALSSIKDLHLVIAGTGAERSRLEALRDALNLSERIHFLGFVPDADLPKLYQSADAFVIAGSAELQSIVTMEAMASGLPVLALNAVALPELVKNGENGFLFDIQDPSLLASLIDHIYSDDALRSQMGKTSREYIMRHDIDHTISAFERIYEKILRAHAQ